MAQTTKIKIIKKTLWIFLSKHYISIEIQLIWSLRRSTCYHKTHLSLRFMFDPAGQLYALTKSSELDRGPMIRYFPGECGLLSTWSKSFSIVIFSHHVYENVILFDYNSVSYYLMLNLTSCDFAKCCYWTYYLSKTDEKELLGSVFLKSWKFWFWFTAIYVGYEVLICSKTFP